MDKSETGAVPTQLTSLRAVPSPASALRPLLAVLAAVVLACSPGRKPDLEPGVPMEREIGGGETHVYKLPVDAGSYLSLRIEQPGVDIVATLTGPDGRAVPVFDDPGLRDGPDRLDRVIPTGGEHRLTIRCKNPKTPRGLYRIDLRALRRARSEDAERIAAEGVFEEGRRILWGEGDVGPPSLVRFEKALRLWEKSRDRHGQAEALIQIAEIHSVQGNTQKAVALSERALEIAGSIGYQEGRARALQALANTQSRLSELSQALDLFERSLEIWRPLGDQGRQGTILYSMGLIYSTKKEFDQAVELFQKAQPLLFAAGKFDRVAAAMVAIGNIWTDRGDMAQAFAICEKARKLARDIREPGAEANALSCLGKIHRQRGQLELARKLFEDALAIYLKFRLSENVALIRQALGSVYFNLGDSETALSQYAQALEIARESGNRDLEARLLTNTGWILQAGGDVQPALAYYRQALAIQKQGYDSALPTTLNNMGVAYTSLQRPAEGLTFLKQALKLRAGERTAQASTLLEIGSAYRALGDLRQAEDSFRQSLELALEGGSALHQAQCLFRWAALDRDRGRLEPALAHVKEATDIVDSLRANVLSDKLRTAFFASKRAYYELHLDLLMRLEGLHPGRYQAAALETSERARARALLDLLAESHIDVQEGIAPQLRKREIDLGTSLSQLQDFLGKLPSKDPHAVALERQIDDVQRQMEGLQSEIRSRYRRYAEVRYPTPLRFEEIQGLLDSRTALVQYVTGREGSFLFVVTREGSEAHRLPPAADLAKRVALLRRLLQERGRRQIRRYREVAHGLYDDLLGPASRTLHTKDRLLISPDGPLYLIPFEALLVDDLGARGSSYGELPYLLRRFAVSYIPSASVLRGLRAQRPDSERGGPPKAFLAFADPDYGTGSTAFSTAALTRSAGPQGRRALDRLTESEGEVRRIAGLYPQGQVALYLGQAATEDNVKKNDLLPRARQIHFATHGKLDELHPQLSGLELAQARGSAEDGTLRVYEIFNLRLNADLLTLSACDTGMGQEVTGEGMIGLTRAFLYAGAKSLVVSLWPVSDRSTPALMFDFYRHLGTAEKAEALRRAKLAMIGSQAYAEPYYWASFILAGDPK